VKTNVPDERLRAAREFAKELEETLYCGSGDAAWKHEIQADKIIAHDQSVYDSALLEAAGLVCGLCKKGIPVKRMTVEDRYFWHHTGKEWADNDDCEAGPIHERLAQK
jgi:hypothetical protein